MTISQLQSPVILTAHTQRNTKRSQREEDFAPHDCKEVDLNQLQGYLSGYEKTGVSYLKL